AMGLSRLREKCFDSWGRDVGIHSHALPLLDLARSQKRSSLGIRGRRRARFAIADDQLSVCDGDFPARTGNSTNPSRWKSRHDQTYRDFRSEVALQHQITEDAERLNAIRLRRKRGRCGAMLR